MLHVGCLQAISGDLMGAGAVAAISSNVGELWPPHAVAVPVGRGPHALRHDHPPMCNCHAHNLHLASSHLPQSPQGARGLSPIPDTLITLPL